MMAVTRVNFEAAVKPGEIWSFDFVHDRTETNRKLKTLTVVDDCSKRSPGMLAAYSITSNDVTDFNGPEMTTRHFLDWAHRHEIEIEYIEPGKPIPTRGFGTSV